MNWIVPWVIHYRTGSDEESAAFEMGPGELRNHVKPFLYLLHDGCLLQMMHSSTQKPSSLLQIGSFSWVNCCPLILSVGECSFLLLQCHAEPPQLISSCHLGLRDAPWNPLWSRLLAWKKNKTKNHVEQCTFFFNRKAMFQHTTGQTWDESTKTDDGKLMNWTQQSGPYL